MDRRSFLKHSSSSLPVLFLPKSPLALEKKNERIIFLGADTKEKTFGGTYKKNSNTSTYTELNPSSGEIYQTSVPIQNGHSVLSFSDDSNLVILCPYLGKASVLFDRKKKEIVHKFSSPEGFLFSGHCEQANGKIYFPLKSADFKHANKEFGKILVVKKAKYNNASYIDTYGLWPHDISLVDDSIVITHAGTNGPLPQPGEYLYDNSKASVCIISQTNNQLIKRLDMSGASPSHISYSDKSSKLIFNSVQWLNPSSKKVKEMQNRPGFQLAMSEKINQRISEADPLFYFDFTKAIIHKISIPAEKARRAVEIQVDDTRNCFYATFSHSDSLFKLDFRGNILSTKKAFDFGLTEIRGLALLGDKYLVASSKYRGIVLLDKDSLNLVSRYDVMTYGNTHIAVL